MQAIMLAAGKGSRILPITLEKPKALVQLNGTPLIVNALDILAKKGITETLIVVGHFGDMLRRILGDTHAGMRLTYIENLYYETTNNSYSVFLTKEYVHQDVLLLECDVFFQEEMIDVALSGDAACSILVSKYDKSTMDGSIVRVDEQWNARELVLKSRQPVDFDYSDAWKTVNITCFRQGFARKHFFPLLEVYTRQEGQDLFYEAILGALIYLGNHAIRAVPVSPDLWCEVDDLADLERAEKQFACLQSSREEGRNCD